MLERTYQASSTDLETAGRATRGAVSSRHDGVGVEEGASAPGAAVQGDADDEGEVASIGGCSTDNVEILLRPSGNKRSNECDDGSELDHCEEQAEDSKSRELKSEERLLLLLELRDIARMVILDPYIREDEALDSSSLNYVRFHTCHSGCCSAISLLCGISQSTHIGVPAFLVPYSVVPSSRPAFGRSHAKRALPPFE